ncbi:MAG: DUF1501 domain-containing protein [Chthoniobacterales bacterium]
MKDSHHFYTRRRFLRTSLLGGALAWTVPSFIDQTFLTMNATAQNSVLQTSTGRDNPILVILQLAGGNDGLNTVVPVGNDIYYKSRPTLALPKADCLSINQEIALHPALKNLRRLYDDGRMSLLQNVGYPNANRSHFRSMEIWQTASDANETLGDGWLGRYFDNACSGEGATVGVSMGDQLPQSFQSHSGKGIAVSSRAGGKRKDSFMDADDNDGGSILELANPQQDPNQPGNSLDFLRRMDLDTRMSLEQIERIIRKSPEPQGYPSNNLGAQFKIISRLITGGMPTRIYYASQGGYDTHINQAGTQNRLLSELDNTLGAFIDDLKQHGVLDRVMIVTFSEFGRRVAENANGGTDHGAAAPMFLLGGGIKPGVWGSAPDLKRLNRGDVSFEIDFRSVYASVLDRWLKTDSKAVLGRPFEHAKGVA